MGPPSSIIPAEEDAKEQGAHPDCWRQSERMAAGSEVYNDVTSSREDAVGCLGTLFGTAVPSSA